MNYTFNYGKSFFLSQELKYFALIYLKCLPHDVTCLVSTGSSGCSIASAMLVLSQKPLKHVHKRKIGENSHSGMIQINYYDIICIVDDFINQGDTIDILNEWLQPKVAKYILVDHGIHTGILPGQKIIEVYKKEVQGLSYLEYNIDITV